TRAPGNVQRVEARSPEARDAFFAEWLKERMQSSKVRGIYIMICKQPRKLQIGLDDAIQAKAFTPSNRDDLAKIMNEQFQAKQFDQGLFRGLDFIETTLAKSAPVWAVKDEAGFFSSDAVEKANASIRDIRRRHQKDVLVETFKEVPPSRVAGTDLSDPVARGKLFG